jgi:hypothetical protein
MLMVFLISKFTVSLFICDFSLFTYFIQQSDTHFEKVVQDIAKRSIQPVKGFALLKNSMRELPSRPTGYQGFL